MADRLELYDRARQNRVSFAYLTSMRDTAQAEFLRQLDARGQHYVAEIPRSFTGWLEAPQVTSGPFISTAADVARDAATCHRQYAGAQRRVPLEPGRRR